MTPRKKRISIPLILSGLPAVILLACYCAAGMAPKSTIFTWYDRMQIIMEKPFALHCNAYTPKTVAVFLMIYCFIVLMYITGQKNYLHGREMGSARYADVKAVHRKLADLSTDIYDPQNIVVLKKRRRKKWGSSIPECR